MTDNVVELKQPVPLAPTPEASLDFGDLQFSLDAEDGWVYIEDITGDDEAIIALEPEEAVALRDWLNKVLP